MKYRRKQPSRGIGSVLPEPLARRGIGACHYPCEANGHDLPGNDQPPPAHRRGLPDAELSTPLPTVAPPPVVPPGILPDGRVISADDGWRQALAALRRPPARITADGDRHRLEEILENLAGRHPVAAHALMARLREKFAHQPALKRLADNLESRLPAAVPLSNTAADSADARLARREEEVLRLAAVGEGNKQIAAKLGLEIITVARAFTRAYRKLNAKNRSDAVRIWLSRQPKKDS